MSDFYGVYAHCRDSAWRCLIDFDVRELPVKVVAIARRAGIRVVKDSDVGELRRDEYGASIKCADSWTIVYDDSLPAEESRFVIAHELGHIFLGHDFKYSGDATIIDERKLRSETQADMFAERLLAPAFALHELEITDADRHPRSVQTSARSGKAARETHGTSRGARRVLRKSARKAALFAVLPLAHRVRGGEVGQIDAFCPSFRDVLLASRRWFSSFLQISENLRNVLAMCAVLW